MVRSNAHGTAKLLALLDERGEFIPNSRQLFGIGFIRILDVFKPLFVGVVPGIDADFFDMVGCNLRGIGVKWMSATSGVSCPASSMHLRWHPSFLHLACSGR